MAQAMFDDADSASLEYTQESLPTEILPKYIYRYRTILTNSAGEQQIEISSVYSNPYRMLIALLQSYRFLEKRILTDLALIRRPMTENLLDQVKLKIAINNARAMLNGICYDPNGPSNLTEGFTLINFMPGPGSIPLRGVFMEILVRYDPDYYKNPFAIIAPGKMAASQSYYYGPPGFTSVEYKFINRYLRSMPQFPGQ